MNDIPLVDLWGLRLRRRRPLRTVTSLVFVVFVALFLAALHRNTIPETYHDVSDWVIVDHVPKERIGCKHNAAGRVCEAPNHPPSLEPLPGEQPQESIDRLQVPSDPQSDSSSIAKSKAHDLAVSHTYRPDGLLEANPTSTRHPISLLINDAKRKWADKLERQSKSLSQAVKEYQRRYKRLPPRGFDIWWKYIIDKNVPLPDEYDQIHRDLEPFFGISPRDLRWLQNRGSNELGTFTLSVQDGRASISKVSMPDADVSWAERRAEERLELIQDVQEYLPDVNFTYTAHDSPANFVHYDLKARLKEAVVQGFYIDIDFPTEPGVHSWAVACPSSSPLYNTALRSKSPTFDPVHPFTSIPKTYVHSHLASMDPCLHPTHTQSTGIFLSQPFPSPLPYMSPTFGMSSSLLHTDILTPTLEHFRLHIESLDHIPWEKKTEDKLLWRGRNTGMWARAGEDWRNSQRQRLVGLFQNGHNETTDERIIPVHDPDEDSSKPPIEISATELNLDLMDISFGDTPVQCDSDVCPVLEHELNFIYERQSHPDGYKYRYVIDVDGNGWSARFKRLLLSNSVILKATVHPDWFTDRIQPWVHYVPVKVDFSDVYDIMTFFRGVKTSLTPTKNSDAEPSSGTDGGRRGGHEDLAEEIAEAGTEWSEKFWRREDMDAYLLRLMLEYARVLSDDRDAMSFVYDRAAHGDPRIHSPPA